MPLIKVNNEAIDPQPLIGRPYKIDNKPVQVNDDLTLNGIKVDGKPVKVQGGTQLHAYDGTDFYNEKLDMAIVDGKPVYDQCHLFADNKEVLMPGDNRVTYVPNAHASLMVFGGYLYYDVTWKRVVTSRVTSLDIDGMHIPDTR